MQIFVNSLGIELWIEDQMKIGFNMAIMEIPWAKSGDAKKNLTTVKETTENDNQIWKKENLNYEGK